MFFLKIQKRIYKCIHSTIPLPHLLIKIITISTNVIKKGKYK
nr:MAG TPA: hypothetical protein [Caudoviricetes sp.]DAX78436.1 MAG TPA: hypothetical protein [Caudoviricetes sp.]